MKKSIIRCGIIKSFWHVIISCILFMPASGCDEKEELINKPPTCSIKNPKNGDELLQGKMITISIEASDKDGDITEIVVQIDSIEVSNNLYDPYNYEWNTSNVAAGRHTLKATARDNNHGESSHEITILIFDEGSVVLETGTVGDYDGNTYETVKIGSQWWMAENLKSTHYSNGTQIMLVESGAAWSNLDFSDKAYCYYDNLMIQTNTYGVLYNWAAAMNGDKSSELVPSQVQGVCPDGWHLPSDNEWIELEMQLGMTYDEAWLVGWRGTNEGTKMKSKDGWDDDGNGTNSSGFSALPAGIRNSQGLFSEVGKVAHFWSTTEYFNMTTYAFNRKLGYNQSGVGWFHASHLYGYPKDYGFSVRCLKD